MGNKTYILLDHEPWTKRRKELFYDLFFNAGLDLVVLDLSQWLHPNIHNPDEITEAPYLHKITSKFEFNNYLNTQSSENTIIIEEVFRNWDNRKVFKILNNLGFKTVKIELYGNTLLRQTFQDKWLNLRIKDIPRILKGKINAFKLKIYNLVYNIPNSAQLIFSSNSTLPHTHHFNHPDYEVLKFDNVPQIVKDNYIVFCDIFFPYHTDLKYFYKIKHLPNGEKYQQIICNYFDFLEKKYKMPVIIAAHPKSNYSGNEFGNRKIIKYQTASLIKYSKMVTMHVCNTTSYALLCDKPIAYIVTNDYISIPHIKRAIKLLAINTLGLSYYNIESPGFEENFNFKKVSPSRRNNYIYSYLTSKETEDKQNSKILYEILAH